MKDKTFIERLTDEQIGIFLKKRYPEYTIEWTQNPYGITAMFKKVFEYPFHIHFFNYSVNNCYNKYWINYLYSIFGEEYKNAYLEYHGLFQEE